MTKKVVVYFSLFTLLCHWWSCMPQQRFISKPRPISISRSKYNKIQAARKKPNERQRFDHRTVNWDTINKSKNYRYSTMEGRKYTVNNNNRNRQINRKNVAQIRKKNKNYEFYRESILANRDNERTSLSIYDK